MCDVCNARDRLTTADEAVTRYASEVAGTLVEVLHDNSDRLYSFTLWARSNGETELADAVLAYRAASAEHKEASEHMLRVIAQHGTFIGHVVVAVEDERRDGRRN